MCNFKIFKYRDGSEYPRHYNDGKTEFYVKHVEIMGKRYDKVLPKIKKVIIGDSEYPVTEIHFEDGLILWDEEVSPKWTRKENEETLAKWLNA